MAILFDLDGTLIDSLPVIVKTSLRVCEELNISVDERKIIDQIGLPLLTTGELFLGKGQGQKYFDTYQKYFYELLAEGIEVFDGIKDLLRELKDNGQQLAIVTSKSRRSADASIEMAGLRSFFELTVTVNDDCGHKPSPDPALYALKKLGAHAENSIFVGDSPFDILCAKSAGCLACGVLWGAGSREQLQDSGADFIAADVDELRDYLLNKIK
ncbi:MAG: HAD-IA family hydrolase [Clostridia bacterium]|nr:HAD-IA family hydrolase [Clostridia bacterium]